jgi:uncharacterized protein (TIGR02271 family)
MARGANRSSRRFIMGKKTTNQSTTTGGTVVGLFRNQADAERAIQLLKDRGFSENQIGVAIKDRSRQQELIEDTGTQTAEGAATGAVSGGVVGGVIGLLAGVGALAIPGVGPIIAGGTLASTLAGAGIGAAAGGLLGALVGMGIPEEDARHFDQGFRSGGTLVTVSAGSREEEARECLHEAGADLGSLGRGLRSAAGSRTQSEDTQSVQLREEELRAEKQRVQAGEVRIRKDVVQEERTLQVPVTREEVVVERRPAQGQPASGRIEEGEEIRVPLMEEEVRVEKTPVVREELSVKKRQVEDTAEVSDTVRREEARVERTGDVQVGNTSEPWRGNERRYRHDASYNGPERRLSRV